MNRQNPDQMNPLRTNPVRTWGYPCSYFPYFSTYSTSCIVSSDACGVLPNFMDFRYRSGISRGIASGIPTGNRKCVISGACFQVTRNSDKLHVAILLLDSGFGEASVTAQGCFFNISQHGHYLNQHHHHHNHHSASSPSSSSWCVMN